MKWISYPITFVIIIFLMSTFVIVVVDSSAILMKHKIKPPFKAPIEKVCIMPPCPPNHYCIQVCQPVIKF